ncbi:polyketide synthase [Favolaschia claudopus]|uniref:Polyketide synthase n=1 Tax=Favolaschia claudopus TaxID=2862362 RepID=A0AAW0CJB5_9AGAR
MSPSPQNIKPVAVVGISAEFPSGTHSKKNFDHDSFFEFLLRGQDAYERVPSDRFNVDGWKGTHLGQVLTDTGCFLKGIDLFDYLEFGISQKDALAMGVATRKLVEHAFLALLDSGIDSRSRNVGVYTSGIAFDLTGAADATEYDIRDGFGGGAAAVANRVSYQMDLVGPSIPVDTACSSSLMSLHLGVQALRTGDCEAAVIGGSQINHRFLDWVYYGQLSILSPRGKSTPFDASADGMGRGEAVVVFVIKLLEDAIRDGDKIYATILSTAINSTGSAGPMKTPIPESQAAAMLAAYNTIGRSPSEADYVECHATGTPIGDPLEANWVGAHFKKDTELLVGSVKGNIGHSEISSFLASLTKICGMFATNRIPPQANYNTPNPAIRWDEYNMRIIPEVEEFNAHSLSGKRLVSINSFGLLGANGHVIVEDPPEKSNASNNTPGNLPVLLVAAGLSPRTATSIAADLTKLTIDLPDKLATLSNIYGRRARQLTWRTASVLTPDGSCEFPAPRFVPRGAPSVVFVFSGQGPQHIEMGRQLFQVYPAFRESILRMDQVHVELTGTSIVQELGFFGDIRPQETLPDIWPVTLTVPSIAMIQMALVDLFAAFGIKPSLVLGHSAGEAAMSYASGALPQALAMEIAIRRSRAMKIVEGSGGMAAVSCTPTIALELIDEVLREGGPADVLELGCYNALEAVTISGTQGMLDKAVALAQERGMFARQIKARVPGHCSLLEPCKRQYVEEMEIAFSRYPGEAKFPTIPTYSTQTGSQWEKEFTPQYMWNNGRVPVKFEQTVTSVLKEFPDAVFIEIGPHLALSSYISGMGAKSDHVLCPMRRSKGPTPVDDFTEVATFLACIGNLSCLGLNTIDFLAINSTTSLDISQPLPIYPFAPKSVPFYAEGSRMAVKQYRGRKGPLNFDSFAINAQTHPDLAQHAMKGEPVLPATGFLEMASMFEEGARTLWNIELRSVLPLLPEKVLSVQIKTEGQQWSIISHHGNSQNERLHATGFMTSEVMHSNLATIDLSAVRSRCTSTTADSTGLYKIIQANAEFGPLFQRIEAVYEGENEVLFKIRGNTPELKEHHNYVFHPAILDSSFHGLLHPSFTGNPDKNVFFLPSHIGHVILHDQAIDQEMPEVVFSYIIQHDWTPDSLACDTFVVNENGEHLVTMMNCVILKHWAGEVPTRPNISYEQIYQPLGFPEAPIFASTQQIPNGDASDVTLITSKKACDLKLYTTENQGSDGGISQIVVPDLLKTLNEVCILVHQMFDLAATCKKRVIRVLDLADITGSLHTQLTRISNTYPMLRLDYTVSAQSIASSDIRRCLFSVEAVSKQHDLLPSTYDIIIVTSEMLGLETNLVVDKVLDSLDCLLVPGGFMIVQAEAINHVASKWHASLLGARFHGIQEGRTSTLWAQKASLSPLPLLSTSSIEGRPLPIIFSFEYSRVLDLQPTILAAMSSGAADIWIEATLDTFNGAVAIGFARSLMQELVAIKIHLVLFDASWESHARSSVIQELSLMPLSIETELVIDHRGVVLVPRICSYPLRAPDILNKQEYWVVQSASHVVQPPLPSPDSSHLLVQICSLSEPQGGLQGIIGTVVNSTSLEWPSGTRIVAVVQSPQSNFVLVHEGQVSAVPKDADEGQYVHLALVWTMAALGLRLHSKPSKVLKNIQAVILHTGKFAASVAHIIEHLGVKTILISPILPLVLPQLTPGDVIIGGLPIDFAATVTQSNCVSMFNWDHPVKGALSSIAQNPWLVGVTIETYLHQSLASVSTDSNTLSPEHLLPETFDVTQSLILADNKFYLILGGIGSLGLQIAIWMYQKGARHIALTSRTGILRLSGPQNRYLRNAVDCLQALPGLDLRLEACDASSVEALTHLISSFDLPLAGCILTALALSDRLFMKQDADSFSIPFKPKTTAYFVLEQVVALDKLDFLIAISSIASFGDAGQSNYAAANTAIHYLTARYSNAWAFVAPAISDSAVGFEIFTTDHSHAEIWQAIALSCYEICLCLEDGLLRMQNGEQISLYIPNLNWNAIQTMMTSPPALYTHLVKINSTYKSEVEDPYEVLRELTLKFIDVSYDDFAHNVPLTSYGLDSLAAAKLSTALKPYMAITQIQLLGDVSLEDLVLKMQQTEKTSVAEEAIPLLAEKPFAWDSFNQSGQTLLKLIIGTGTPLIMIHGGAGDIAAFRAIQEQFTTPLWALQPTPETPLDSVESIAQFYFAKIKEARSAGPYRIGAFSASSLLAVRLVQLLERTDDVVQFTFVDHFPMIFTSAVHGSSEKANNADDLVTLGAAANVDIIATCCKQDALPARRAYGENVIAASRGLDCPTNAQTSWEWIQRLTPLNMEQLIIFIGGRTRWNSMSAPARGKVMQQSMITEFTKIRAPMNVYIAKSGIQLVMPQEWSDYGVSLTQQDIHVEYFDAGHFDIFEKAEFSHALEFDWVEAASEEHQLARMVSNPANTDLEALCKILDSIALRVMAETVRSDPQIGREISRQRLFAATKHFVHTQSPKTWTEEEERRSRELFPLYFEITERISKVHAATMESPAAAVNALYSDNILDAFYRDSPVFTSLSQEAAKRFKSLVLLPEVIRERPIRVLEVGAGVGGLTKFLVESLCDIPGANVEYTVTDLSFSLAKSLAQSFTYKHIGAKMYDLTKPPAEQGLELGYYDIITSLNCIHAVGDLNATLRDLHSLLAPGGHLLIVDTDGSTRSTDPPRPPAIWNDFVWGSFQGWFGFTDSRNHCTIDEAEWRTRLGDTGYANIQVCQENAGISLLFEAEKAA